MDLIGSFLGGRLVVAVGDICEFQGDAIVNAANSALAGGGGVDGAIHRAAGPELAAACRALRDGSLADGLPAGRAVATTPGRLKLKAVIHAVGPIWRGGSADEERLLYEAYRSALALAEREGWKRVAFPAIATGVYGFPKERAAALSYKAVKEHCAAAASPRELSFVFFSAADGELFRSYAAGRETR